MCVNANYVHLEENSADYALHKEKHADGDILYIFLQWSHGEEDWKNNFDFPARPYKDMPIGWRAHRGFVKVWKTIEPNIADAVKDTTIKKIIVVGYSHGAALACLAHEYVWFNRPDIREQCIGIAFESPRVFCGFKIPKKLKERWKNFVVFRNGHDIVTHVPPAILGYKHVGTLVRIGESRKNVKPFYYVGKKLRIKLPKFVAEHDFENVRKSLNELTEEEFIYKLWSSKNFIQ